jgi:MFS family permease
VSGHGHDVGVPQARQVLRMAMVGVAAVSFPNSLIVAALPLIADDLHAPTSVMAWVSIAPAIAFSISMPMFGKLGDLYGHRRVFLTGFSIATVLALATSLAPNVYALIALRTTAQLCGTSTIPSSFAMLALVYPPNARPRVFGQLSAVLAVSPVVAIVFGAPLVEAMGWRLVFVAQAIPAALTVLIARPRLPETPRRPDVHFDITGAAALAVCLSGSLLALNRVDEWGATHPFVLASAACGLIGFVQLIFVERRATEPLIPLQVFRRRNFTAPIVTMGVTQAGFVGSAPLTAFLLGDRFGYSTIGIGLVSATRPAGFAVASWLADRSAAKVGGRVVQFAGNAILIGAGVTGAIGVWHHALSWVVISALASGFGVGYARPGIVTAINNSVDAQDVGLANGVNNMAGQIGSSIGTTVLLAFVGDSATRHGFTMAYVTTALFGAMALGVGQTIHHRPRERSGDNRSMTRTPS